MQRTIALTLGLALLAATQALPAQTVVPLAKLDQPRYTGTWYEIARLPTKRGKNCSGDVIQEVAGGDKANQLQFVNACMTKRGYLDATNATGRSPDKSGDGKLKITTFWPFSRKYWILAIGPDYDWSLAGNPNHKELWIFSRKTTLAPEALNTIKAQADAMGYPSAKLLMTPQTPR